MTLEVVRESICTGSTRRKSRTGRIESFSQFFAKFHKKIQKIPKTRLTKYISRDRIIELSLEGLVNRGTKKSFEKVLTRPSEDDRMI
ncbi:hypothetical protein ODT91_10845, partial [Streptococcus suis]